MITSIACSNGSWFLLHSMITWELRKYPPLGPSLCDSDLLGLGMRPGQQDCFFNSFPVDSKMKPRLGTVGWGPCYLKLGLQTGSIRTSWEVVPDAESTPDFPSDNLKIHSSRLIPVHG